jgi:Lyzozyme M1 (1,4-beta-N-acetylmuramidase)
MDMSLIEGQYKIWMAQYNTSNSYGGKYEYWQYTSSGTVPGLIGAIDCNFWYYDNNAEATKDGTTSIKDASVSLSSTSFDYDASAHKPSISVTYAGMIIAALSTIANTFFFILFLPLLYSK